MVNPLSNEIGSPSALELEELNCMSSACGGLRPQEVNSLSSACGRPRPQGKRFAFHLGISGAWL